MFNKRRPDRLIFAYVKQNYPGFRAEYGYIRETNVMECFYLRSISGRTVYDFPNFEHSLNGDGFKNLLKWIDETLNG